MKKKLLVLSLLFTSLFNVAQTEQLGCDFIPETKMYDTSRYSATVKSNYTSDDPIVFNVFYHIINPPNETNPEGLTEEDLLFSIAILNINFNQFNIFYKYRGYREIDDIITYDYAGTPITVPLYNAPLNEMVNYLDLDQNYGNNINIIGTRPLPQSSASIGTQRVIIPSWALTEHNNTTIVHEFGHLAGLLHTFEGTDVADDCQNEPDSEFCLENTNYCDGGSPLVLNTPRFYESGNPNYQMEENVTRDTSSPLYNADTKGDMITDTPAAFYGSYRNICTEYGYGGTRTYISDDQIVDSSGSDEKYIDVNFKNFMSYYSMTGRDNFTNGQGVRMRETIEDISNTQFVPRMTTVSSLYEPYKSVYHPYDDGGNDDEILMRSGLTFNVPYTNTPSGYNISYFQPGFDYEVYNCHIVISTGETTTYDINFTYDKYTDVIPSFDLQGHSIKILQVGDELGICYPFWMVIRTVVSGSLYTHDQETYNVQPLDSTSINSVDLLNDLPNGIHTININTNTGETSQKTILK